MNTTSALKISAAVDLGNGEVYANPSSLEASPEGVLEDIESVQAEIASRANIEVSEFFENLMRVNRGNSDLVEAFRAAQQVLKANLRLKYRTTEDSIKVEADISPLIDSVGNDMGLDKLLLTLNRLYALYDLVQGLIQSKKEEIENLERVLRKAENKNKESRVGGVSQSSQSANEQYAETIRAREERISTKQEAIATLEGYAQLILEELKSANPSFVPLVREHNIIFDLSDKFDKESEAEDIINLGPLRAIKFEIPIERVEPEKELIIRSAEALLEEPSPEPENPPTHRKVPPAAIAAAALVLAAVAAYSSRANVEPVQNTPQVGSDRPFVPYVHNTLTQEEAVVRDAVLERINSRGIARMRVGVTTRVLYEGNIRPENDATYTVLNRIDHENGLVQLTLNVKYEGNSNRDFVLEVVYDPSARRFLASL
jgi:hypothetical protein